MADLPASKAIRQASPGWLIQRLSQRFEQALTRELAPHGLALGQFAILMSVLETDGQSQTDLGTIFAMPAWQISRHLDGLEAAGLVQRRADPTSRRTHRIHATAEAAALAPRLRAAAQKVNTDLLAALDAGQRRALIDLLQAAVLPGEAW